MSGLSFLAVLVGLPTLGNLAAIFVARRVDGADTPAGAAGTPASGHLDVAGLEGATAMFPHQRAGNTPQGAPA